MNTQLFEGELVRLAPPEPERDAEIESRWTHDTEYMRLSSADPVRPLSPTLIKKKYEEAEKEKATNRFHFAIRAKADDRLVGFVRLEHIEWNNGGGRVALGIGDANDRGRGYGAEALKLILRYAFAELNLYRVTADTFEYNERALRFLERAGFVEEVRRRQAVHRDGKRWDAIKLGLLRDEWERVAEEIQ
jgi:RimJ/RimL family protein N-acetyltransferase